MGKEIKMPSKRYLFLKRVIDIFCATAAIFVLFPFMVVVALAIVMESKGSPVYTQKRVGKNGKIFKMYKFRSMYVDSDKKLEELMKKNEADGPVFKIKKDPRVTKVGRFIRRYSIDELLQLFNIIKGDMSVIGPRPALPREVEEYDEFAKLRLKVNPGLSCYWQVMGRSDISFDEWMKLDIKYINDMSLITDLKIVVLTLPAVFKGRGAY